MSSGRSAMKLTSSNKASQSTVKKASAPIMMTKTVTRSMTLLTASKPGSANNPQHTASKSVSAGPFTTIKQPSLSRNSSAPRSRVSTSRKPTAASVARTVSFKSAKSSASENPSHSNRVAASTKTPVASVARTTSNKHSTSQKASTQSRSKSAAMADPVLKSAAIKRADSRRKYGTVTHGSASTKKQSVIVTELVSSTRSGIVSNSRAGSTAKIYSGHAKTVSKSEIVFNPSLALKNMSSVSKRGLALTRGGNPAHPNQDIAAPRPVIVVERPVIVVPRPVDVQPGVGCHCCCGIERRRRRRCDWSTRRGFCSSSSSEC